MKIPLFHPVLNSRKSLFKLKENAFLTQLNYKTKTSYFTKMPENLKSLKTKEFSSNCGVLIDIDGVVLKGGKPFPYTKESLHKLWNNNIPFAFLTNGTYTSAAITNSLTSIIDLPFDKDHFIVAPSPCKALTEYHDRNVLVCCQDDGVDLIPELGFKSYITMPELSAIFPELDYVDHKKRIELNKNPLTTEQKEKQSNFKPIEAIVMLGEPINWECHLQLILDVLMLNGDPRSKFKTIPKKHLPIIAANKDLTFKATAQLPRFGHGAFLECLETLYKKITKNDLKYEVLMGKPCLVTYEFAAVQIQKLSKMKYGKDVTKFYLIGDNPDVDIRGANNFKQHLLKLDSPTTDEDRLITEPIGKSTIKNQVESILVSTGVYNPQTDVQLHLKKALEKCQSDYEKNELSARLLRDNSFINYFQNKMNIPDLSVNNLNDAVDYILKANI